jgi:glycerol-3-phosphate cytidylyltransferase
MLTSNMKGGSLMKKGKKIVLLQGTFDPLNWGHVKAFKLAKSHGDILIIALNTDELIHWFKKREPIIPFYQRKEIIESIKYVDKVIPIAEPAPINFLKKYQVDVYVLTKEWEDANRMSIEYMKKKGGKVVFSPRFNGVVCSTDIRRKLFEEFNKGEG